MTEPVLAIKNLTIGLPKHADRSFAVHDLSLEIRMGETLCVVGESGSGKSAAAHAVMGLLPKALRVIQGEICLEGNDLLALSEEAMRQVRGKSIGMVFQEPMTSLNPVMRVGNQIAEALEAHGRRDRAARRRRVEQLLDDVGLQAPVIAARYPHELSGGQRQRVMIAQAIALEPKLIIADEPTTALDVTTQSQILRLLKNLQTRHDIGMLFITHDFGVVAEIADRVVVLNHGICVEQGPTSEVLHAPQDDYTRRLLLAVPSLTPPAPKILDRAPAAIVVQDIAKTYRARGLFTSGQEVKAAKNISFTIRRGETLGLVGESGSGKSTVGRCVLRLIEPDTGSIKIGSILLRDLPSRALRSHRKRLQMVFQDPFGSLNPRRTVGRIIAEGPVAHGMDPQEALGKARELLKLTGLSIDAADRYPHEFSGGQRQRIGIARALALEPDVLIADEPVSALDVSVQAQILKLIKSLQNQMGLAILFVTHDLRVAAQICDNIAVMHRGEIVELRPTGELFADPHHPYTKLLLAAVPGVQVLTQTANLNAMSSSA